MFKIQNIFCFFSLIGLCSTALAAECTLNNSDRTIYLNKGVGIIDYTFQNCKKKIKSSEYQWLDTKDNHIIFKSSDHPQHPINVIHTNQNFIIIEGGGSVYSGTSAKLSHKKDYLNYDVRAVQYQIMMGYHLLPALADYQPGDYDTSVKLSVNY
ncbi:hypothetical protein D7V64_02985 [Acinetobacter cumulans]|uniref:Uncharacterized protein n=1 Tax=Acinetobacter cumulans TaxID=2136182 RepID=A0A3A8GII8_9GAMM|nr:hypothetical protein [Acinetobacter cumulans]RKG55290.1 hypothetical protein D7V64_02985 [Acinetobacter cumulans]